MKPPYNLDSDWQPGRLHGRWAPPQGEPEPLPETGIRWQTVDNAPCCPGEIVDLATGQSVLVQTDWDCPSVATSFGWHLDRVQRCTSCGHLETEAECGEPSYNWECPDCGETVPYCDHSGTDGTVDCGCGLSAGDFINAARDWLAENDGVTAEDPGYFLG